MENANPNADELRVARVEQARLIIRGFFKSTSDLPQDAGPVDANDAAETSGSHRPDTE